MSADSSLLSDHRSSLTTQRIINPSPAASLRVYTAWNNRTCRTSEADILYFQTVCLQEGTRFYVSTMTFFFFYFIIPIFSAAPLKIEGKTQRYSRLI